MVTRARAGSTCELREYMLATATKPEEQATAVLATALRTSGRLRHALLERLELLQDACEVEIDTEVQIGHDRDAVDIEFRAYRPDRRLAGRAWLEVKVNSGLAGATPTKPAQLVRYPEALDDLDRQRPDLGRSRLVVLLRRADEKNDRPQITATGTPVMRWQEVADAVDEAGRQVWGGCEALGWREAARRPEASLELANLDTLAWFLEEARRRTTDGVREAIVGVSPSTPITADEVHGYAEAYRAITAMEVFDERLAEHLADAGRITRALDVLDQGDGVFDSLIFRQQAEPHQSLAWWPALKGQMEYWLMPFDYEDEGRGDPLVWAGVGFDDPIRISADWLGRLDAETDLKIDEDEDGAAMSIGASRSLGSFVEPSDTLTQQASRAAAWIDSTLARVAEVLG